MQAEWLKDSAYQPIAVTIYPSSLLNMPRDNSSSKLEYRITHLRSPKPSPKLEFGKKVILSSYLEGDDVILGVKHRYLSQTCVLKSAQAQD
jgi:hypothetical protein